MYCFGLFIIIINFIFFKFVVYFRVVKHASLLRCKFDIFCLSYFPQKAYEGEIQCKINPLLEQHWHMIKQST